MIDSGRVASGGPPQASGDRRRNFLLGWVQEPAAAPSRAEVERDRAALRAQIADSQRAFKSTVAVRLGAGWAGRVKWARGPLPVISNLAAIRMAEVFDTTDRAHVLDDVSAPTALEQADGDWELAVFFLGGPSRVGSVSELTARYNQHVWPARARPSTRSKNWRYWSLVVTWAVARKYCAHLVPMSADTLKAITWDLIVHAASRSLILAVWAAVQSRHAMFHLPPPIVGRGEFSAWVRSLSTITGCPSSLKLPIHRSVVAWLLRARPCTVAQHRSRLLTSLATLACLRVREVANLQVCDLWFDYLPGYGIPGYEGTCGIHVLYRKNDSYRKGHWPALGRSSDPALDLVVQLRSWLGWMGLSVHNHCEKRRRPAARCAVCWPLFPRTVRGAGNVVLATHKPLSRQMVSDSIKAAVTAAGACPRRFSGISARKGGISTAIEAGVGEDILYLQSGHGVSKAGRPYMHIRDPARLLETFAAFQL